MEGEREDVLRRPVGNSPLKDVIEPEGVVGEGEHDSGALRVHCNCRVTRIKLRECTEK